MIKTTMASVVIIMFGVTGSSWAGQSSVGASSAVERGRYLVQIAGCNDCHTPSYAATDGKVPEVEWLTGDHLGWRGAWGTTYPANLRLFFSRITESEWLKIARGARYRPPMPSSVLHQLSDPDLQAIYRFSRFLGPAGKEAPAYVPPGGEPLGPVVQFPM